MSSGDSFGNLVIWDFKTSRILNRVKVHQKALVSHAWLPHETVGCAFVRMHVVTDVALTRGFFFAFPQQSKVITSSFDGTIKMLD